MEYRGWLCGEVVNGKYWRIVLVGDVEVFCVFAVDAVDWIRGGVSAAFISW